MHSEPSSVHIKIESMYIVSSLYCCGFKVISHTYLCAYEHRLTLRPSHYYIYYFSYYLLSQKKNARIIFCARVLENLQSKKNVKKLFAINKFFFVIIYINSNTFLCEC